MDIKSLFKDKKTLIPFAIAGGLAGIIVYLSKGKSSSSSTSTGDPNSAGVLQDQQQQFANQMQQGLQLMNQQFGDKLYQQQGQFQTTLANMQSQEQQKIDTLTQQFQDSQSKWYNQVSDLSTQVTGIKSQVNTIPVQSPIPTNVNALGSAGLTSTPKAITVYATGADKQILQAQYGSQINIVDNGYTQSNMSGLDRTQTNANFTNYLSSQGVTQNNQVSQNQMWGLGGSYPATNKSSSPSASGSSSSKSNSSPSNLGAVINHYSDKTGSYTVYTGGTVKTS